MGVSRRRMLQVAAASLSGTTVAGCLAAERPDLGGDGTPGEERTPGEGGKELARIEEPQYAISEPRCGAGGRDPLWLCANMPAAPSLQFEQVASSSFMFTGEGLQLGPEMEDQQFYATLLTTDDDLDRVDADADGEAVALIKEAAFDEAAVLVAQTGWGSGTVTPHLKRIEETADGLHAFGCYRRPCGGTADETMRTVVARVARPNRLDEAVVSLTVDPTTQVNFAADEGVVTVDEEP